MMPCRTTDHLIFAILLAGLAACHRTTPSGSAQLLDAGRFTMLVPPGWAILRDRGVDSYVGRVAIGQGDTLDFDLGWYSNDLAEYRELEMDGQTYFVAPDDTDGRVRFLDSASKDGFTKSNVAWDTIDGRRAKILTPKKPGDGVTGLYMDSLWQAGASVDRFNLYGKNLKPDNEKKVLNAFKTLKFRKGK